MTKDELEKQKLLREIAELEKPFYRRANNWFSFFAVLIAVGSFVAQAQVTEKKLAAKELKIERTLNETSQLNASAQEQVRIAEAKLEEALRVEAAALQRAEEAERLAGDRLTEAEVLRKDLADLNAERLDVEKRLIEARALLKSLEEQVASLDTATQGNQAIKQTVTKAARALPDLDCGFVGARFEICP